MKSLGYMLITLGFLVGTYFSVIDTEEVTWSFVVPSLLVGLFGVALIQVSARGQSTASDAVRTNIGKLEESLARIVDKATQLDADKESINVYDVHHRIDEDFMTDLDIFVENRESIGHAFGLQSYANVMTHFATAERYLNRCWSASSDGYTDEVNSYLTRARDQFTQALDLLRTHTVKGGSRPT
jgi:hypothetical protein